jgi:hypothetical protein
MNGQATRPDLPLKKLSRKNKTLQLITYFHDSNVLLQDIIKSFDRNWSNHARPNIIFSSDAASLHINTKKAGIWTIRENMFWTIYNHLFSQG